MNLPSNCTNADIDLRFGHVTCCQECHAIRLADGHVTCKRCSREREISIDTPPAGTNLPAQ